MAGISRFTAVLAAGVVAAALMAPDVRAASATTRAASGAGEWRVAVAARGWRVQLAAYRSRAVALAGWRRLAGAHPDLLAAFEPGIERVDLGTQMGVFFRLRIGPFADARAARRMCRALGDRGVDCFVIPPETEASVSSPTEPAPPPATEAEAPPSSETSAVEAPTPPAPAPVPAPPVVAAPEPEPAPVATAEPAPSPAPAPRGRFSGFVAPELRIFPRDEKFAGQEGTGLSVAVQPEYFVEWDGGAQNFAATGFARLDQHDGRRTHLDLREFRWEYLGDDWMLRVGADKVFWGALESEHLVDIINQTDLVEDPDGEDKLGQPMVSLALDRDWGTTELFVMPYFHERTFAGAEGRLRTPIPVDVAAAEYEAGAERYHPDLAIRWARSMGPWDIGLAHFYGTSREPRFLTRAKSGGGFRLVPRYDLINQTSVDLQGAFGDWLLKFEAMTRTGHGERIFAAGGGFEYTITGAFDSQADVGLLLEVLYDDRNDDNGSTAPPTLFDNDVFTGLRFSLNDVDGSEVLAGVVTDWRSGARAFSIEASRRLGEQAKIGLEARTFDAFPSNDFFSSLNRDDYIQIELSYYF